MYRMTDAMQTALGYDAFGNNPDLVCEADKEALSNIPRASGDATCDICHALLRLHPSVQGALWATRACYGIVKL
jgi:hypothetical protein